MNHFSRIPQQLSHLFHVCPARTLDTIALAGHVRDTHNVDQKAWIVSLEYALEYVPKSSHRTLIGRQDARTLLYNIRSSVEVSPTGVAGRV